MRSKYLCLLFSHCSSSTVRKDMDTTDSGPDYIQLQSFHVTSWKTGPNITICAPEVSEDGQSPPFTGGTKACLQPSDKRPFARRAVTFTDWATQRGTSSRCRNVKSQGPAVTQSLTLGYSILMWRWRQGADLWTEANTDEHTAAAYVVSTSTTEREEVTKQQ